MGLKKILFGDYVGVGMDNQKTRAKWIEKTLNNLPHGESILDAGAGELKNKVFCEHLKYTSQDFGQYDGIGDGVGIQTDSWDNSKLDIVSDIASMPLEDNAFDNVFCSEVFEHIPHPVDAAREMIRVLKPGGKLIITAPFCSLTHFAPYHFYNGFNTYFYEKWLEEFGCEIIEMTPNGNYFEYVAQEVMYASEMGVKYANVSMSFREKIGQKLFLGFLKRATKKGDKSKEVLNFGIHVIAQKK